MTTFFATCTGGALLLAGVGVHRKDRRLTQIGLGLAAAGLVAPVIVFFTMGC
ncbi:hypothetical protein [Lacticaseibacillus absianus]|uniref:hypothetical protein n=1 Tax=Lacticaseibacillus absianus TaxID=2729623 RepID=UPI0015CC7D3E|nr:hypothetical protein [Lacticaseibacillus absianus]